MERNLSKIKERILYFTDIKGFSKELFFKELGVTYGNFKGKAKEQALSSDVLEIIISKYPEINIEWLLTGKGEMLKNKPEKPEENNSDKEIIEMQKQLLESQKEQIELLKEKIANLQRDKKSSTELHK